MDIANNFYQEVLQELDKKNVKYILIGGLAVGFHGYQRYTGDMDLWLEPTEENLNRLYKTLVEELQYPVDTIKHIKDKRDIEDPTPIRLISDDETFYIDLMTNTFQKEFSWNECRDQCQYMNLQTINVPVLHINHLISMKENTKRLDNSMKDLVDAEELKKIRNLRNQSEGQWGK
jgi:predicted nucleotidyltransferase